MKSPFFTIVLTTYNRKDLLSRAIGSVVKQTFNDFELIIIDDASTDGTEDYLESLKEELKTLKIKFEIVLKKENKGVNHSRNIGIDKANGKWLLFLDDDDYLVENALEEISKTIYNFPGYDSYNFLVAKESGYDEKFSFIDTENEFLEIDFIDYIKGEKVRGEFLGVLRTDLIKKYKYPEFVNGYEGLLWLQMYKDGMRAIFFKKALRIYDDSTESICRVKIWTLKTLRNKIIGIVHLIRKWGNLLKKYNRKNYALNLSVLSKYLILKKYKKLAFKVNFQAFKINPLELRIYRNFLLLFIPNIFLKKIYNLEK